MRPKQWMSVEWTVYCCFDFFVSKIASQQSILLAFVISGRKNLEMLTQDQIEESQKLFLREFGYEISTEEAFEYASKFIDLLLATYKPKD